MTSKKARPVKAKALGKRLRGVLEWCAKHPDNTIEFSGKDARAILAALKHEREAGRQEGIAGARALESER